MPIVSSSTFCALHLINLYVQGSNQLVAWKVHFNGHGKGNYEGEMLPKKLVDMQEYYYLVRKYKDKLKRAI